MACSMVVQDALVWQNGRGCGTHSTENDSHTGRLVLRNNEPQIHAVAVADTHQGRSAGAEHMPPRSALPPLSPRSPHLPIGGVLSSFPSQAVTLLRFG